MVCIMIQGAFYGLAAGTLLGIVRMIWEFSQMPPLCGEVDTRSVMVKDFHYLYFSISLFLFTSLIITVMSLVTPEIDEKHVCMNTLCTGAVTHLAINVMS